MMSWLDRITGRATMYRLVLICLIALAVEALLVGLTGALFYTPLAMLASGAVAVVVTLLAGIGFARLFRVRQHTESSLITGFLLFFLFSPTLDPGALGAIALAAVLASASKYLLAVRGRHIFNPAALGALIVSLLGLDIATWWVATPWLLPIVAIGAFVILYRTRRLPMGVLFVVLSTIIVTLTFTTTGTAVGDAITIALSSYPIVFLAGFMLSEPLTLPPRRWQQLALAVVVALVFSVPFHFGPVYNSPALALVIGNLLAFLAGQRRGIRLDFLGKRKLDSSSWELSFHPQRPIVFRAGQFMELSLPHRGADVRGLRRVFSIASAPSDTEVVSFGLRTAERSSSFKSTLLALEPGETITATAIGGDFVLPRNHDRPVLLVAGGIGVTPYVSQLAQLKASGEQRDVVLVYAATSASAGADDLAYAEHLDAGGHRVLLVSPTPPATLPANWSYLGAGPLTAELLSSAVPDVRSRDAYVSGPPAMVRTLRPALRRAGVRRVKTDYFAGY